VSARNQEFDPFADVYNRCFGADYHANAFPVLERLLLSGLPPGAPILDVCCGTGQFTRRVVEQGFAVVGIDASGRMLDYARRNVANAEFLDSDVRDFSLGRRFSAAYSVFESLNHVPDLTGLTQTFQCVLEHLEPGAHFLFDLNGEEAFAQFWNDTNAIVESDMVCVLRSNYDEDTRLAKCEVTLFEQGERWNRRDFTLQQTCHSVDGVHSALESVGFGDIQLYDAQDAGMSEHTGYNRTFFLAKSPAD
jgi:SAM-dependent methyltransferase